jgi:hypothetical protein
MSKKLSICRVVLEIPTTVRCEPENMMARSTFSMKNEPFGGQLTALACKSAWMFLVPIICRPCWSEDIRGRD